MDRIRRPNFLFICLALGMLLLFAIAVQPALRPQPVLDHRPLSFWLDQLRKAPAARHPDTVAALASRPDASLPPLRKLLMASDGPLRSSLISISSRHPCLHLHFVSADATRTAAAQVLEGFGPKAIQATDALIAGLRLARNPEAAAAIQAALLPVLVEPVHHLQPLVHDQSPVIRIRALRLLELLCHDRPPSPALALEIAGLAAARLTDPDPQVILEATEVIRLTAPAGESAVPRLVANLHHPSDPVREASARSLGTIGRLPAECVVALARALADSALSVRVEAAAALGRFGIHAADAVDALARAASDPHTRLAVAAVNSLGRAGISAAPAVPVLLPKLRTRAAILRAATAVALGRIGARPDIAIPALADALLDEDAYVRQNAARALAVFGPRADDAVGPLTRALRDPEETVRVEAAVALGRIGPAARAAIPDLKAARNNNQSIMTRPVLAALQRIEGSTRAPEEE